MEAKKIKKKQTITLLSKTRECTKYFSGTNEKLYLNPERSKMCGKKERDKMERGKEEEMKEAADVREEDNDDRSKVWDDNHKRTRE